MNFILSASIFHKFCCSRTVENRYYISNFTEKELKHIYTKANILIIMHIFLSSILQITSCSPLLLPDNNLSQIQVT